MLFYELKYMRFCIAVFAFFHCSLGTTFQTIAMQERIRQIMDHYGLSQQNFAAQLGVAPATISSIFTGRTNPTNKHVQAIHKAFPEIDTNWLMFGEGEMLLSLDGKREGTVEDVCAACHGADGNSTISANPKLAGQHAEYIRKQLQDFTPPEDGKPARCASAVMGAFASSLEPQDIVNVAAYFAAQKLTAPAAASNAELVELGQSIYRGGIAAKGVPACAACHGPAGDGMPAQYPQLRGQFAEYTTAQLVAFRDGARKNNHPMAEIALRMTDPEIKAVADYIAGLRPEGGTPEAKPADAPKPEADKKDEANKEADE